MRALLLPIKDLRNAKQRLVCVLSPEERLGLVQAMLADTVRAVRGVMQAEKVFVITNYAPAMELAEENRWEVLREDAQISESDSVDAASRLCEERGVTSLLRLPLDIPLVQSCDIDELLAVDCEPPALVIVPSRDGTGTNAMLRTPPTLFPSHFGHGSFAKHVLEAEQAGARVIIRNNARLETDVDDEGDLRLFLEQDLTATETGRYLKQSGIADRFSRAAAAGNAFAAHGGSAGTR